MSSNSVVAARRKAITAAAIGNIVEWYDFGLYGYFASTIASQFFAKSDPTAALLGTFAIFGVGILARPLGGIVFGRLGDRIGRRRTLMLSVMLMSAGTVGMGLLPGYREIGTAAAVLLLVARLVQGFSAGGEYTGSAVFVIEHTPRSRRGLVGGLVGAPTYLGSVLGIVAALVMAGVMGPAQLASWGWRVPFIAAAPLALIGLYLRLRVDESPEFEAIRAAGELEPKPVTRALKSTKKRMLVLIGWTMANATASYLLQGFLVTDLVSFVKLSSREALLVTLVAVLVGMVSILCCGWVIDVVGRKRVAVITALALGVWSVPAFLIIGSHSLVGIWIAVIIFAVLLGCFGATSAVAVVELFPAGVRASASGMAYNFSYAVFGGGAPYIATVLVGGGFPAAPGYYLAGLCAIAALSAAAGIGNRVRGEAAGHEVLQVPRESSPQTG